jgi:hypothetical protein
MPIKITSTDFINKKNMLEIVSYYNLYLKQTGKEMTSIIELVEYDINKVTNYGFRIQLKKPMSTYVEGNYKQVRWQNKNLASVFNYPAFSQEEELLLYKIMRFVLGKENVTYYSSFEQAIINSPNYNRIQDDCLTNERTNQPQYQNNTIISNMSLWRQVRTRIGV